MTLKLIIIKVRFKKCRFIFNYKKIKYKGNLKKRKNKKNYLTIYKI